MTLTEPRRAALRQWLADNDCEIHSDITSNCNCDETYCGHIVPVFVIRTFHDPSVGIFGVEVSPWCKSEDSLFEWLARNQEDAARLVAA